MMNTLPSPRTRVARLPERGHYDRSTIDPILDAAFICHVGFAVEDQPYVIPTLYGRRGDEVLFHGSAASRMLRVLADGAPICLSVTLVDGLVLARSLFHSSMNYRSVVLLGKARLIADPREKNEALRAITEHFVPGRWDEARLPNDNELRATSVLSLPIDEASAKVRSGPPGDEEEDYSLPIWAGEIPLSVEARTPIPDPKLRRGIAVPASVSAVVRRARGKDRINE